MGVEKILPIVSYEGKLVGMKSACVPVVLYSCLLLVFIVLLGGLWADEPNIGSKGNHGVEVKAAMIICRGMIDNGLYESIKRRTQDAIDDGARYLVYEIGTYGGLLESGDDISKYLIIDVPAEVHTVAYVATEAISAGVMVSTSCEDIIMLENATIGDCAPVAIGGELEGAKREKAESFIRAALRRAAEANGYPAVLLEAMVSMQLEVYRVKNLKMGQFEFFQSDRLPTTADYDLEGKELIVKKGELLTLTASQALEYGIARAIVKDRAGVLEFLADRDGVSFARDLGVYQTNWSEELVRWLNSPAVMGILILLAMLGVYIELSTPGVGLAGLVAVVCIVIIIGSKYLIGLANWAEVALFVVGVLLLAVEVFVLPGFGIAGIAGVICILGGLFGMLVKNPPDRLPWPDSELQWRLFADGALGLLGGFVGFVVLAWLLSRYVLRSKLRFMSGLILVPACDDEGSKVPVSMTSRPRGAGEVAKVGDIGVVVTALRPAGKARFGEKVLDCVAQAEFIDKDAKVEIIEIHGNRVVVASVDDV